MAGLDLRRDVLASAEDFVEDAYLRANPDVAAAVAAGNFRSGRHHFNRFGVNEKRRLLFAPPEEFYAAKRRKLARIEPLLRPDLPCRSSPNGFDFLSPGLRAEFNIVDTDAVSSNDYDGNVIGLIDTYRDGMLLDCGAGKRRVYYDNVVNFEIVAYDTTDVRGVGEVLPFRDASFDAVVSVAVLEHVKDPFRCAKEILRVLKPGGDLYCAVPFLQPYHGYPHHYYNMTQQGLRNLFGDALENVDVSVPDSVLPIWSLTWILSAWADGLDGAARETFLSLRVADLLGSPQAYLREAFVRELSLEKNLELASACVLKGRKKDPK